MNDARTGDPKGRPSLLLRALVCCLTAALPTLADVTGQDVKDAIQRAITYLKAQQDPDGSWHYMGGRSSYDVGMTGLAVLALHHAGVPADDPAVANGVTNLLAQPDAITYSVALKAMALAEVDAARHKKAIQACADWLIEAQCSNGMWSYQNMGTRGARGGNRQNFGAGDNSNTQFAVLGLHAAFQAGVEVPENTWKLTAEHFTKSQNKDGGWGYNASEMPSYGSMTGAGLSSLFICGARLFHPTRCGDFQEDRRIAAGLDWVGKYFSTKGNPYVQNGQVQYVAREGWDWYYLYSMERVGILSGHKYLGGKDWYRLGATLAVDSQQPDGGWGSGVETSFALLYLAKGHTPLLLNKLKWGADWSNDLYDAKGLVELTATELKRTFAWQAVDVTADLEELMQAPVLYFNGHTAPNLGEKEARKLKEFTEEGGLIFCEACCGSEEFDRGMRKFIEQVFGDRPLEPLPPEHPVYRTHFQLGGSDGCFLKGVTYACRTALIYSPRDLSCSWDPYCPDKKSNEELARQVGINVLVYGMGDIPLRDRLDRPKLNIGKNAEREQVTRGAFVLGQLRHDGDWNPDPVACGKLMEFLRTKAGLTVVPQKRAVHPLDPNVANYPLLYMTGHEPFQMSTSEREAIAAHLKKGALLFAESCCGKEQFDAAFRKEVAAMFPENRLEEIPSNHPIFRSAFPIERVSVTPTLQKAQPNMDRPLLEGVFVNKELVVVYSRYSIFCRIEDHPCPLCMGYKPDDAFQIAANVILYALTR